MSKFISVRLGNWPVCLCFGLVATIMFTYLVPHGVAGITENRTLAPRILDEYYLTWTQSDARTLYAALGQTGRRAYQLFYLQLDFWFPVMSLSIFYAALLSLAFPQGRGGSWLNLVPIVMYGADVSENINHFMMAGRYPDLPPIQLAVGPYLTLVKYVLITVLPLIALVGFGMNRGTGRHGQETNR